MLFGRSLFPPPRGTTGYRMRYRLLPVFTEGSVHHILQERSNLASALRRASVVLQHAHFARHRAVVAHLLDVADLITPMQLVEIAGQQAVAMEV
jgi:uncharacterized membrane protein (DUF2068 family)